MEAATLESIENTTLEENYARMTVATTKLAAAWCEFLEGHARKVYSAETSPGVSAAHALAKKIEDGAVADGQAVRDIYRPHWANLRTPESVHQALEVLAGIGWVRLERVNTGGRPADVVRLHPDFRGQP